MYVCVLLICLKILSSKYIAMVPIDTQITSCVLYNSHVSIFNIFFY